MTTSMLAIADAIGNGYHAGKLDAVQADQLLKRWRLCNATDGATPDQFIAEAHRIGLMARPRVLAGEVAPW